MIRIALHPRDPVHALNDQIIMIFQLKEEGFEIVKYADADSNRLLLLSLSQNEF